jgi:hypothetical protein
MGILGGARFCRRAPDIAQASAKLGPTRKTKRASRPHSDDSRAFDGTDQRKRPSAGRCDWHSPVRGETAQPQRQMAPGGNALHDDPTADPAAWSAAILSMTDEKRCAPIRRETIRSAGVAATTQRASPRAGHHFCMMHKQKAKPAPCCAASERRRVAVKSAATPHSPELPITAAMRRQASSIPERVPRVSPYDQQPRLSLKRSRPSP